MKEMIKLILLVPLFSFTSFTYYADLHPIHVSKAQINYDEKEKAFQVSLFLFLDDLEEALRRKGHDHLNICTKLEAPEAEGLLTGYLRREFRIWLDEKEMKWNFIGKEISTDLSGAWCYMEISDTPLPKKIRVQNSVLMELFDDQQNIIHISLPGEKEGYLVFQKGGVIQELNLN